MKLAHENVCYPDVRQNNEPVERTPDMNASITIDYLAARNLAARTWDDVRAGRAIRPLPEHGVMFLTTELGTVDFAEDGSARVYDSTHAFAIPADATPLYIRAAQAIREGYRRHGAHTLACDCGAGEVVVDADASTADVEKLARVIEHALYDHATRRDVLATVHTIAITPADFGL